MEVVPETIKAKKSQGLGTKNCLIFTFLLHQLKMVGYKPAIDTAVLSRFMDDIKVNKVTVELDLKNNE